MEASCGRLSNGLLRTCPEKNDRKQERMLEYEDSGVETD